MPSDDELREMGAQAKARGVAAARRAVDAAEEAVEGFFVGLLADGARPVVNKVREVAGDLQDLFGLERGDGRAPKGRGEEAFGFGGGEEVEEVEEVRDTDPAPRGQHGARVRFDPNANVIDVEFTVKPGSKPGPKKPGAA